MKTLDQLLAPVPKIVTRLITPEMVKASCEGCFYLTVTGTPVTPRWKCEIGKWTDRVTPSKKLEPYAKRCEKYHGQ
jgi:hypothetical protein